MELTFGNSIRFGKKIGTDHWAVSDPSNSNTNATRDTNNETLALKP